MHRVQGTGQDRRGHVLRGTAMSGSPDRRALRGKAFEKDLPERLGDSREPGALGYAKRNASPQRAMHDRVPLVS